MHRWVTCLLQMTNESFSFLIPHVFLESQPKLLSALPLCPFVLDSSLGTPLFTAA